MTKAISKKNIAVIVGRKPSLESGGEVRNYYLVKGLKKKFNVSVHTPNYANVNFMDTNGEVKLIYKVIFTLFGKIPYIEKVRQAQFSPKELNEIMNADFVQIQEMESYFIIEKYLNHVKGKLVLDTHNIDYRRFLAEVNNKGLIEKYIGIMLAMRLRQWEINAVKRMNSIIVCSKAEKKYFSMFIKPNKILMVPNGAKVIKDIKIGTAQKNNILFMGLLGYLPNAEALKYYINCIHPKIIKTIPDVKLVILGKDAPAWLIEHTQKDSSIDLKGFVKDVKPYIQKAKVCICPILSGSGTRLKILEYMAMSKPVVSSSIGAEGIITNNNTNILLANSSNNFSANVIKLLKDEKLAKRIGDNAKSTIELNYNWDRITNSLCNMYLKL